MDTDGLKAWCAGFPGAQAKLLPAPSNVLLYQVLGKQFAYFKTSEPERWRFSVRVTPDRFLELTDVPGVKPARYMARFHWVTIVDVAAFDEDYLRELVAWSYRRAVDALPKGQQARLAKAAQAARDDV
ncbi:MmcQ/YjbR family DNA-binding protein [Agrilutibacter solisilvae]|uniref:MmcQ/YjbR family DNA-binding protein n=1 Tax=Agrilutibacter solisilvae TaxID=2763317 RepID=A0A975ASA1_9GAMM|nr:MmcQ/YjbR family DNA-binding protein [Lysobacter solisilvae]QSX77755.1 MmcQ/YjbR family DNA-binding protein [Lysobacter solisilvae]